MPKTTSPLLGIQELAEHLGVSPMDVKNWRRRGKLPEPLQVLATGPVWERAQFPAALKRQLVGNGRRQTPTTTPRSDTRRRTTPAKAAGSRKRNS